MCINNRLQLIVLHLLLHPQELAASCRAVLAAPEDSVESMGLTFVASNHSMLGGAKVLNIVMNY